MLEPKSQGKPISAKKTFFERHYGVLSSKMTVEEMDVQLKKLREEWERDVSIVRSVGVGNLCFAIPVGLEETIGMAEGLPYFV